MNRILMAAARGARIQARFKRASMGDSWCDGGVVAVRTDGQCYAYRIHPDDAHLQYGPLSSHLRAMAANDEPQKYDFIFKVIFRVDGEIDELSEFEQSLLFLIEAEALADEGM